MKKLAILMLALLLVLNLVACNSSNDPSGETEANASAPAGETEGSDASADPVETDGSAEDGCSFTYNGVTIAFHAPAGPIIDALGEPKSYTEQASCAFEGLDKTYYYGSFYLDTYPMGEEDFVYGWWFADDSVTTQEGIYIGASQAQVEAAYGADTFNGANSYIVNRGEGTLTVIVEEGVVTSIQYAITLD